MVSAEWLSGSYLFELLFVRPLVVLLGLRRRRLRAAGLGRRYSGQEMHGDAFRRAAGSLERGLSVLVVVETDVVRVLLLFIQDLLLRVDSVLVALLLAAVPVHRADLHVWKRHHGARGGHSGGQGAAHRRVVMAENQGLLVDLGLHHRSQLLLFLRLPELLIQSQPGCLLALQILHDRFELHAAAAALVGQGARERAVGGGGGCLEGKAAGGREGALLRWGWVGAEGGWGGRGQWTHRYFTMKTNNLCVDTGSVPESHSGSQTSHTAHKRRRELPPNTQDSSTVSTLSHIFIHTHT